MLHLLVLTAVVITSMEAIGSSRLELLEQPIAALPAAPRPRTYSMLAWSNLARLEAIVSMIDPSYSRSTPIQTFMTEAFCCKLQASRIPNRFVHDMSYSKLPFNLSENELTLFKSSPDHPLFTPVSDLPFKGLRARYLKSRLVVKNHPFAIDVLKALQQPISEQRILFYRINEAGMVNIATTLAQHLAETAEQPLCKHLFAKDFTKFLKK